MDMAISARDNIEALERDAPWLDGAGDRFSGYAIIGLLVPHRTARSR